MSRRCGGRGFRSRGDDIFALRVRSHAMHEASADRGMPLELGGERPEEVITLLGVDRRCGGLYGGVFVIGGEGDGSRAA